MTIDIHVDPCGKKKREDGGDELVRKSEVCEDLLKPLGMYAVIRLFLIKQYTAKICTCNCDGIVVKS